MTVHADKNFEKNELKRSIRNRDCQLFIYIKKRIFWAKISLLESENDEELKFSSFKMHCF